MKKLLVLAGLMSTFSAGLSAQSFAFFAEAGQLLTAGGAAVTFGDVDGFYAVTSAGALPAFANPLLPTPEEVAAAIGGYTWSPLVDITFAGGSYGTPNAGLGLLVPIAVGQQPLIAFFDNVASPSQVAIVSGDAFLSNLDNRFITLGSGNFTALSGVKGSLSMVTVVPEPSTYALLGGLLALGFVVYRRRR